MTLPPIVHKKLGPFPVGTWLLGGATVGGMVLLLRRHGGGSSAGSGSAGKAGNTGYRTGGYSDTGGAVGSGGVAGNRPDAAPVAAPIVGAPRNSPSLTPAKPLPVSYVGQNAGAIAAAGVPGLTRTGPTEVRTVSPNGQGYGSVSPTNVLKGYFDPATNSLSDQPGPGRVAMWA